MSVVRLQTPRRSALLRVQQDLLAVRLVKATLPLGVQVFCCDACGLMIDRDLNAARNLAQLVDSGLVAASSAETQNACGEGSAGPAHSGLVELPSAKQERTRSLKS
jgi:hypothetical protein